VRLKKSGRSALVVPVHHELKKGTLARILHEAGLHPDDLRRLLEE
jgi:predicted RNA binding protein YcfA (HicA-like mRNA interferase family)